VGLMERWYNQLAPTQKNAYNPSRQHMENLAFRASVMTGRQTGHGLWRQFE